MLGVAGGLDLAWIGDGANYHTRRDTLENMRSGSLQHTGSAILGLLPALLRLTDVVEENATEGNSEVPPEVPFYQDLLGMGLVVIRWKAFLPLAALVVLLLLLDYKLQQRVLGVQTSIALVILSCLSFGCSCLAAATVACCCTVLGALVLQLYGTLYVHWPIAAACRALVAFAALAWFWNKTFFRKYECLTP